MEPFRFVHAADLHIDSPFAGLRDVDQRVADRLQEATYEAFRNLVDLCVEVEADFLIVAGDVYDGADRSVRAQLRFRDGLAELAENGIQSFIAHGNHDSLDGWQSAISWPEGVHIFGQQPEWKTASTRGGAPVAAIQGVSFPKREVRENLALAFAPPAKSDLFNIGVLHCNVGGNPDHDNYAPCTVNELSQVGLDYWALGHVHTRQVLRRSRPAIAYPGNSQGRHPNETGPRGCFLVEVGADRTPRMEFQPLDVVRWETCELPVSAITTLDGLIASIEQSLEDISARAEGRDVVCRLVLTGRGPMHAELAQPGALADVLDTVRLSSGAGSPWVWVERIADETRAELDLDARARQDDFLGATLKRADAALKYEDEAERIREALADMFSGRRGSLPEPTDEEFAEWVNEARWYLAELLESEA
ncbi:MAG: DNA repair exonuclease [Dehalococcoidia bacterium]